MKVKLVLVTLIIISGCHCEKKPAATIPAEAPKTQTVQSDEIQSLNNLLVSFYSKGSGINREAAGKFDNFLMEYIRKTNTKITYKKTGWGREGELDYCISLSVMNSEQRSKFITAVKDNLRQVELVHLFENHPCRDMK
ncbi:MAG TPA: hypothetical protein VI757_02725 [Bacteroidia bacterium]|nr:hypothetical protein [Bacteroidia bacterium]